MQKKINKKSSFLHNSYFRLQRGFTLIEMMVAITIFSLIMGTISTMFVSAIKEQRRALAMQKLLDETSYVLEYMSRAVRMAKKDDLDGVSCLTGDKVNYELTHSGQGIKFKNYNGDCQEFFLENNQLKEEKAGLILPMTSTNIKIEVIRINLIGQDQPPADKLQPRVTIFLDVKSQATGGGPGIKVQTTLSQRKIDIQY